MATLTQLIKKPRIKRTKRKKARLLEGCPQRKAVCTKVYIQTPKKPNSAKRKVAKLRFSCGAKTIAYIPGEGHNLQWVVVGEGEGEGGTERAPVLLVSTCRFVKKTMTTHVRVHTTAHQSCLLFGLEHTF